MRIALALVALVLTGCAAPQISWTSSPAPQVTVGNSVTTEVGSSSNADLEWRVTPQREWVTIQPRPGAATLVASPTPGSSGAHELDIQARQGSGAWSDPIRWSLVVVPRELQPFVRVVGDEGCTWNTGDGQMDQSFTGVTRVFPIDFGQTFNVADITRVEIRVDTDGLNNLDVECLQGTTAFCPDYFKVEGTNAEWSPTVSLTHCDRLDPGEAHGFFAGQDRPVLEKVAANTLRIVVSPSTGDDCIVSQIVVVVWRVESKVKRP